MTTDILEHDLNEVLTSNVFRDNDILFRLLPLVPPRDPLLRMLLRLSELLRRALRRREVRPDDDFWAKRLRSDELAAETPLPMCAKEA